MGRFFLRRICSVFAKAFCVCWRALLLEAAADPPPAAFQKLCKEPHYKKPTQINSTEKKLLLLLLLLLQPAPPTSCNNQNRKQLNPQHQRQHRKKRRAIGPKPRKNPDTKIFAPPLNTHKKSGHTVSLGGAIGFVLVALCGNTHRRRRGRSCSSTKAAGL